jgi:membrane dipeptidase
MSEVDEFYNKCVVIDMRGMPRLTSQAGVDDFKASGITMANIQGSNEGAMLLHKWYMDQFDEVNLVNNAQDILKAKKDGAMCLLMSMEHPNALNPYASDSRPVLKHHLVKLEQFYDLGLRRVQLSYNRRTMFANGCTERVDGGLSYYGVELVEKMNELGMIVDCGHVGIQSSIDAVEVSKKPILYSHTGCRAVYDHPRSKTDEALKALAEKGGVAGIYNVPSFISPDPLKADIDDFLNHIDHAVEVMGVDHVGIGSDQGVRDRSRFPGSGSFFLDRATKYQPARRAEYSHFVNEVDLKPHRYMPGMAHHDYMQQTTKGLLGRGYSKQDVKKIIGDNFLRVCKEVL